MQFLPWSDNSTPDVEEDDPARRQITLFSKVVVWISSKCPNKTLVIEGSQKYEYGFYHGHIHIENPVEVVYLSVCETCIKILETLENPDSIIASTLRKNLQN